MACEKETIRKFEFKVFDVLPEADTVPTKVLVKTCVIYCGEYTYFHDGAYNSFSPTDTTNQETWNACGDGTYTSTDTLFYLNPGTYEIRLDVKDGESYSKSFTLF